MTKLVSLKKMPKEVKILLLRKLGYDSDGKIILKNKKKFLDKYINEPIKLKNMIILPGRSPPVVLDNNPLSVAAYLEEYGENVLR